MSPLVAPSPLQTFEDNIRPAELLLRVYKLLNSNDSFTSEGELVDTLREVVDASESEELLLIYNEIFLGLVREKAKLPRSTFKQITLNHLLRQAVVASCTALETYLPSLLRDKLPILIGIQGREFLPRHDQTVMDYFSDLKFNLDTTLRLLGDENAAEYISKKILSLANFKYLSSKKGVHVVGALLGLESPWDEIADHLSRDKRSLMNVLKEAVNRRNDIVHRADRPSTDPSGDVQDIRLSWTQQSVDTINHICLALDELVADRVAEIKSLA